VARKWGLELAAFLLRLSLPTPFPQLLLNREELQQRASGDCKGSLAGRERVAALGKCAEQLERRWRSRMMSHCMEDLLSLQRSVEMKASLLMQAVSRQPGLLGGYGEYFVSSPLPLFMLHYLLGINLPDCLVIIPVPPLSLPSKNGLEAGFPG